jgi:outer membrane protease
MVFFMAVFSLSAQIRGSNAHSVSLGASTGLLFGVGEELLYRGETSEDRLSQLLWHFEPLFYAGADVRYSWQTPVEWLNVFVDGSFKYGIQGKTGVIEDSDWTASNAKKMTHYSVSDNTTEWALLADANIGGLFLLSDNYAIKGTISYRFMYYSWIANGGSFLYPDDGDSATEDHMYVDPIYSVGSYEQTWHIISPGVSFYGVFNEFFEAEVFLKASPFVWLHSKDGHWVSDTVSYQDIMWGLFIEPGFLFSFKPNSLVTVSLAFSYRNISGVRGDLIHNQTGNPTVTSKNTGGAGYSAFDVGILARFNLIR